MKSALPQQKQTFDQAESLYKQEKYEQAAEIYLRYADVPTLGAFCTYRLAQIANISGEAETAYSLFYSALEAGPDLFHFLLPEDHPFKHYVFKGMRPELENTACTLCGRKHHAQDTELPDGHGPPDGPVARWCYAMPVTLAYTQQFNPIRLWMYCPSCHHMYARHFPEKLFLYDDVPRPPQPALFPVYSQLLARLQRITAGSRLFEVGIGGCECALAARELGYEVYGIDVIERHVREAREKFGVNCETADFLEFDAAGRSWDIIIMGDVLEHVGDPRAAVEKARDMLADGGVLWISTPNFDSAFSIVVGHDDPMRMQAFHLNYFSRDSLFMLLGQCGMVPVDYQISAHYRGSMEVACVKKEG